MPLDDGRIGDGGGGHGNCVSRLSTTQVLKMGQDVDTSMALTFAIARAHDLCSICSFRSVLYSLYGRAGKAGLTLDEIVTVTEEILNCYHTFLKEQKDKDSDEKSS